MPSSFCGRLTLFLLSITEGFITEDSVPQFPLVFTQSPPLLWSSPNPRSPLPAPFPHHLTAPTEDGPPQSLPPSHQAKTRWRSAWF